MSDRRLLFYNDSRHYYLYCYDPPISLADVRAPVDELLGTRVDTLVYGSGPGATVFHNTRVGEIWGERFDGFDTMYAYRAAENIRSLIERGLDPLDALIDRAHEKDIEFFASLRMANPGPPDSDSVFNSKFNLDHPEWCLRTRSSSNFNYVHPEVRAERFALAEEYVSRYDVDGLELDWVFEPVFFEEGEVEENTPLMTGFVREIRQAVDKAAGEQGRSILLGARVLPTRDGNLAAGLDVPTWIHEGLLDFVVPNFYGCQDLDVDFPFEWLVQLARETECKVYPALQARIQGDDPGLHGHDYSLGTYMAEKEHYYAGAATYWDKGADGIYLPWFRYPNGANHQMLSEIHDPDTLREKPKHYVVRCHNDAAAAQGYDSPLPLSLVTGSEVLGQTLQLYIADDAERAHACLKLRLADWSPADSMTLSLNGQSLPGPSRRQRYGYRYDWLEFDLSSGALQRGLNEVGVAIHDRPPRLHGQVTLESVEVVVSYATAMPAAD